MDDKRTDARVAQIFTRISISLFEAAITKGMTSYDHIELNVNDTTVSGEEPVARIRFFDESNM